jgi:hypothetical protein
LTVFWNEVMTDNASKIDDLPVVDGVLPTTLGLTIAETLSTTADEVIQ